MARLKDVNYSQSGGEDSVQQVRNIEEAQIAMHEAPNDTGLSYKVFKLTDTGKKGKYHRRVLMIFGIQTKRRWLEYVF